MLFLSSEESIYITSTVLKMINSCVSQQSIAKQILVNNLRLVPDLSNVIKEFIFYDNVSQVSQDVKKYVIGRLNLVFDGAASNSRHGPSSSYVEENGMMMILEGYGEMATTGEPVRYRHIAIKCLDSVYGLQYVICYKCGNYILSESSSAPQILCNCGVVNLVDDEEEEAADADAEAEAEAEDASEIDILEIINWNFPYEEAQEVAAYMEYAEFQEEQEEHAEEQEEHAEEQEEQAEEQEEQEEQEELHEAEFNLEEIVINLEDEFDLEYSI